MATPALYIENDNLLQLSGLFAVTDSGSVTHPTSGELGEWVNDATVTATLYEDEDGTTEVSGQDFPVSLEYVTDSDGVYEAILDDALELEERTVYYAIVDVDAPTQGIQAKFIFKVKGTVRRV